MGRIIQGKNQTVKVISSKKERKEERYKDNLKNKNSKQCIKCESNQEGYCNEFKMWCSRARIECAKCIEKLSDYASNGLLKVKLKKTEKKKQYSQRLKNSVVKSK